MGCVALGQEVNRSTEGHCLRKRCDKVTVKTAENDTRDIYFVRVIQFGKCKVILALIFFGESHKIGKDTLWINPCMQSLTFCALHPISRTTSGLAM